MQVAITKSLALARAQEIQTLAGVATKALAEALCSDWRPGTGQLISAVSVQLRCGSRCEHSLSFGVSFQIR